jgi:Cu-Zn family superoxide dismutase
MTLLIVAAVACGGGEEEAETAPETPEAAAPGIRDLDMMINPLGDSGVSGTASFTTGDDGNITVFISLSGASEGSHAAHIHEIGDCSAPDGTSAGGHWNPTTMDHGQWGTPPHHLGDLGNIEVDEFGAGALTVTTPAPGFWSIGTGEINDIVGKAIIVHEKVDDFTTQPTGAAGGRIACGVINAP